MADAGRQAEGSDPRADYSRPQVPARIGIAVIAAFAGGLGTWSALAPLSDAAIADGSLQVQGRRQAVQHPYGGVVKELRVAEGDHVRKGQTLIVLSGTELRSRRDVLLVEKTSLLAAKARLIAERDGRDQASFPPELSEIHRETALQAAISERAMLHTRNRQHEAALDVVRRKIEQLQAGIEGDRAQADGLERQLQLVEEELAGARKLLEQGYTPRTRVLALERDASRLKAELGAKRSEIASARRTIAEAEVEMARLDRTRLAEVAGELRSTLARLSEIEPEIAAAEDALARTEILAPATGEVVALKVFTEGGVIEKGAPLLEIVPSATPFFVDARLKLTELDGIEPGQQADVQLLTKPRSTRPRLRGEVETVSADRLLDDRTGEGYYALQVRLDPDDVRDADVELQAGMPVQVVMPTRARTLLDYLTSPLLDEVTGAFRER